MKTFPWWGSILLAVGFYCGLKYGIPRLIEPDDSLTDFINLIAPIGTIGFLLLGAKQLYDLPGEDSYRGEKDPGKNGK